MQSPWVKQIPAPKGRDVIAGTEVPGKAEGPSESRRGRHGSRHPLAESGVRKPMLVPISTRETGTTSGFEQSYRGVQSFTGGCACPTAVFNDGE